MTPSAILRIRFIDARDDRGRLSNEAYDDIAHILLPQRRPPFQNDVIDWHAARSLRLGL
jgi:hypothetical protein